MHWCIHYFELNLTASLQSYSSLLLIHLIPCCIDPFECSMVLENLSICLYFLSFLNAEMALVLETVHCSKIITFTTYQIQMQRKSFQRHYKWVISKNVNIPITFWGFLPWRWTVLARPYRRTHPWRQRVAVWLRGMAYTEWAVLTSVPSTLPHPSQWYAAAIHRKVLWWSPKGSL